jgi:hypothetical protein
MNNKTPTTRCPACTIYAAISSVPHCTTKACTWNRCDCGYTYDRYTTKRFKTQTSR